MAIRYLSYKDLSPNRRVKAGLEAISNCRRQLALPGLTPEQRQQIEGRIVELGKWMSGTLEAQPAKHHTVRLTETLSVSEKV